MTARSWWVGLDSWVLQDGSFTDFVTGERRQFALEFAYSRSARLRVSPDAGPPRCRHSGRGAWYDVHSRVLRSSAVNQPMADDAFVLDLGLLAYKQQLVLDDLQGPASGAWLDGEVHLAVDHFSYMDRLALLPDMPPLIYTWTIDEIRHNPTPQLGESWQPVQQTRTWDLDGSYLLRCTLELDEATSTMARSGSRSPYGPLENR